MQDQELSSEFFEERLSGILPEIELPGQVYEVDWRNRMLRAKDNTEVVPISLREHGGNFYGDYYYLPYDVKGKKIVELDFGATALPKNVVIVKFPGGLKLDPVGMAREYRLNVRAFVEKHPVSKRIIAEVILLNKTEMVRFVELNRQKQLLQKTEKASLKIKTRKGKGL